AGPAASAFSVPPPTPASLQGTAAQQTAPPPLHSTEPEFHVSLTEPEPAPSPVSGSGPDNVRAFPSPASTRDASLQLARHVTRLLAEARQQIQAAAREAAAQAVAAERRINADQWDRQVAQAREQLSQELSSALRKVEDEAVARTRAAHEAAATLLQEELPKRLAPQLEELTRGLTGKLSEEGAAQRAGHHRQLAQP